MKLDFKRIMSSVLAFVMLFSSLVMVNVVSVSAATSKLDFSDPTTVLKLDPGQDGKIDAKQNDLDATFTVYVNSTNSRLIENDYFQSGSKDDYITVSVTSESATITVEADKNNKNARSISIEAVNKKGTITENFTSKGVLTDSKATYTCKVSGVDTYKIKPDNNSIRFYTVTVTDDSTDPGPSDVTWSVVDSTTQKLFEGKVAVEDTKNSAYTILRYTANDGKYSIIPSQRIIESAGNSDVTNVNNAYTLTLTDDNWTKYIQENLNIPIGNIVITGDKAANRVLHLECQDHGTVYSIKLDESGKAMGMLVEEITTDGTPGGYKVEPMDTIPLHSTGDKPLIATMAGGQLDNKDTQNVTLTSTSDKIEFAYTPYEVKAIDNTTEKVEFNQLKVTSIARAERLLGGTVLDKTTNHFFVVANKDAVSNSVFALTDPIQLGTDTDMKALVIRRPESSSSPKDGVGFTLAEKTQEENEKNVSYTLKIYCTAVADPQGGNPDETSIAIHKIDPGTLASLGEDVGSDSVTVQDASVTEPTKATVTFDNLQSGNSYAVYNKYDENQGNLRIYAMELEKKVDDISAPSDDNVWSADKQTDLLGAHLKGKTTSKSTQDKFTSTFEKQIFTEADGSKSGAIKDKNFVLVEKDSGYFQPSKSGELSLYAITDNNTGTKSITIKHDSDNVISRDLEGRQDSLNIKPVTFDVQANEVYTLTGYNIQLYYAELVPSTPAVTYPVTISGTNNTGKTVTVNVMKGDQVAATASIPSDGTFTDVALSAELTAGEYTLSAKGFTFSPATITVNAAEETTTQKIENITIDESKNVTVKFEMSDGTKPDDNIKITPTGSSAKTISKSEGKAVTFSDVAPGTQFKIESTAKNVWKWVAKNDKAEETNTYNWNTYADSRKYIKYDTDHLTYTLPDAASIDTSAEYGVTFTASSDMATAAGDTDSLYVKNTASDLSFGQYAFGDSKALDACGRSWARNYVKFKLTPLSLSDFSSKRTARYYNSLPDDPEGRTNNNRTKEIDNAYAALSQNTVTGGVANATNYIEFTIDSDAKNNAEPDKDLTIQIDRDNGIDLYNMTDGNTKVNASAYIADSNGKKISKQEFPVKAGKTYRIVASGHTYAKSGDATWEKNEVLKEEPSGADKTTTSATVYVKSIRMFNPNNIFDGVQDEDTLVKPANEGKLSEINGGETALKKALTDANADISRVDQDATVFRIIGMLDLAGINGLDASSKISRDDLENAAANIAAVGYDVYAKEDYDLADTQGNYYHEGMHTTSHQPSLKESIEITDVVNTGYDLNGTEEEPQVTGTTDPENLTAKVFTQTFYATKESLTLVPWVKYAGDDTKVYSLVQKTDGSTSNNKELIVE